METKYKQPFEVLDFDIDASRYINDSDSIASASAIVTGADNLLVVEKVTFDGPIAKVWISGGANNVRYKVTVYIVSAQGRAVEAEFMMEVEDT